MLLILHIRKLISSFLKQSQMRIPLEHFTRIPVSALSGTSSSRQASSATSTTASQANPNSVGSAPSSPEMRRRNKGLANRTNHFLE